MENRPLHFLCITSYFKGEAFLRSCKEQGNKVYLITSKKLQHEAWPWDHIDDVYYMEEDENNHWNMEHLINGIAYKMRDIKFDRFVSLDDFDVEKAAHLRENFRIPGMGETTARYFRDKLAMRMKAHEAGIPVPEFTALFHNQDIHEYTQRVSPPWMLKPRLAASAAGIKKIHSVEELWHQLDKLGDERPKYLLEKFAPGDVYHVDALNVNGKVVFSRVSQYINPPFDVAHGGGIFRSVTTEFGSKDDKELTKLNKAVMKAFGMNYSASHTEFIKGHEDGKYYFLETSSRVGGANLADMVEASSGINLWAEWAKIETALAKGETYELPEVEKNYAGIVVSLSRYEKPGTHSFTDPEICWRMNKDWHIGLIVKSDNQKRVIELLDNYARRIAKNFHASAPAPDKPTN
ncbi:MAG: ATP-grasp domain-containing protein [Bacteroidetes bacterium]|nr:ATP-grasp domain-containing protein [Bacteroidota bacterium]